MNNPVSLQQHGDVAVLHIDNPPVNALSPEVIDGLAEAIESFEKDSTSRALLVHCAGSTFVAGADISIFDRADFTTVVMNTALQKIENCRRPVVAVLHGTALGGGFELTGAAFALDAIQSGRTISAEEALRAGAIATTWTRVRRWKLAYVPLLPANCLALPRPPLVASAPIGRTRRIRMGSAGPSLLTGLRSQVRSVSEYRRHPALHSDRALLS